MLLHEFGTEHKKIIVMIHGLCMSWDMQEAAIRQLSEEWHVIAVAVPGMDPDVKNAFDSVERITARIEKELLERGYDDIDCLYGLSMGGGIALRMLADDKIHFQNAVIDAGITPYELPRLITRVILVKDVLMTLLGRASKKLLEMAFSPEAYTQNAVDRMFEVMQHMTLPTIWRAYDSTDNYSMPEHFPIQDTKIWYWYGSEEKKERKLDLIYMKEHIPNVRFRKLNGMRHGQYLLTEPEQFAKDIKRLSAVSDV